MKKVLLFAFACFLFSASCKHKEKKVGEINSLSDLKDYAENIVEETKKAQSKSEERRKRGDTLAIGYKELQSYLPQISGYSSEKGPKGSQTTTPGMGGWSQAEQTFNNGDKRVEVSIMDYNAAHETFLGLTSLFGLGMTYEDDNKKQGAVDMGIDDVKAYETIYKQDKRSELVLVVGDRFVINLKSNGENDEGFLRSIARNMNLEEFAPT